MTDALEDTTSTAAEAMDVDMAEESNMAEAVADDGDEEQPSTQNDEPPPRLIITKMVRFERI